MWNTLRALLKRQIQCVEFALEVVERDHGRLAPPFHFSCHQRFDVGVARDGDTSGALVQLAENYGAHAL